ncbi:757_t:CDS:2 [Paraglomus occultum]|uniref:757_t:CDS:1 n=1 Tax=Paraglomus occultum TaxID=144539 RepID=A0A9N9D019_9GLOM|nr:757_t:CDS:2 [Paraglomus occultum]
MAKKAKSFKDYLAKIEDPKYQGGSWDLPENASPLEKKNRFSQEPTFLTRMPNLEYCPKLKKLDARNSNLPGGSLTIQDLPDLVEIDLSNVNLEELDIGRTKFHGSLAPLAGCSKLKELDIRNTDIDGGLEYLPDSLQEFNCSANQRKDAKCTSAAGGVLVIKGAGDYGNNNTINGGILAVIGPFVEAGASYYEKKFYEANETFCISSAEKELFGETRELENKIKELEEKELAKHKEELKNKKQQEIGDKLEEANKYLQELSNEETESQQSENKPIKDSNYQENQELLTTFPELDPKKDLDFILWLKTEKSKDIENFAKPQ